jgi:hypothetical protein
MRPSAEKQACPRRRNPTAVKTVLHRSLPERGGKGCWDAEQSDRHLVRGWGSCGAHEPLCPREAKVRALRTGEDHVRFVWRSGGRRRQAHFDALLLHELQAGAPMHSSAGVAPQQRCRAHSQRMQQHTHEGSVLPSHSHCIDTARVAGRDGTCSGFPRTPRANCHRFLDAAHGDEEASQPGIAGSHQAGEESRRRFSAPFSEAGGRGRWAISSGRSR